MAGRKSKSTLEVILNSDPVRQATSVFIQAVVSRFGLLSDRDLFRLREEAKEVGERIKKDRGSPYKVLGVDPDAPQNVVKAAWHSLMKEYKEVDNNKATRINLAYEEICSLKKWPK